MKEKLKNIIYGFVIGDALGVPFEFQSSEFCKKYYKHKYIIGTHNQIPGTWSDDSSILFCILNSKGDVEKYKQNLKEWYNNNSKFNCFNLFDIGIGTRKAIESDFTDNCYENKGNGCLCVALGCYILGLSEEYIDRFVKITHNNVESITSTKLYIRALREEVVGAHKDKVNNNGYCLDSLNISIISLKKGNNFKSCIKHAIDFGGDTDSHAAFTGALAAIKYDIPKYYLDNLQGKEKINNILNKIL